MPTTVADSCLKNGIEITFSDIFSYHQQLELLRKKLQYLHEKYLAEEPDVPLSKVISKAFTVLRLNTTQDTISNGEYV